jgi:hypothetical protein
LQRSFGGKVDPPGSTPRKEDNVAEIRIERKQHNLLPWLLGLALLAVVVIGLVLALAGSASGADAGGAQEVVNPQEPKKDETPRRLQQWAALVPAEQAVRTA